MGNFKLKGLALVAACWLASAAALASPGILELSPEKSRYALGRHMTFLEDKSGDLTIEEVSSPGFQARFQPSREDALNFGVTSSAIWVKCVLRNTDPEAFPNWLLSLDYPLFDYVSLYYSDRNSGKWTEEKLGDRYPFRNRKIAHRNFLFELPMPDTTVQTYYLRFATSGSLQIGPHLHTERELSIENMYAEIGYGLFFGALLIMIGYNLFLFFSLWDRAYLAYVLVILFSLLVQASFSGHINQYLLGNAPVLANGSIPLFMAGAGLTMNFFAITFLDTRRFARKMHLILMGLMVIAILDMILVFFLPTRLTISLAGLVIMVTSLMMIVAGVNSLLNGNKSARYFLLAWVMLLAGVLITSLRNFGLLMPNFFTVNSMKFGAILEVILLSMALSDKYNLFKKEKETTQAKMLHMQQEANKVLEEKVQERTLQLAQANEELSSTLVVIEQERQKSDQLLLNILPEETAAELKEKGQAKPKHYDRVSVLFTDFRDFTRLVEQMTPQQVIEELSYCFTAFDDICDRHRLEKIKTIGDSYMAAGGLPRPNDTNPADAVSAALEILEWTENWKAEKLTRGEEPWEIRIGIHTGPVVAGVVGKNKFAYDIWGDTVNHASRMESGGQPGHVNISEATYQLVRHEFHCVYRGEITVKNLGDLKMYWVEGRI
ncbi:MAG: hypothetical protein KIPDCIKN_02034 [Haliscomenobacter sp.]|jgi:class 3 adenylate cyclase|nr:hypothetical protein [Haliscomenobacter sp.]